MEDDLKRALENVFNEESAAYLTGDTPRFSKKFEREMEQMLPRAEKTRSTKNRRGIRAALIASAAAAMLGLGLTAGAAATDGFTSGFTKVSGYDEWNKQPTVKFSAANDPGAPEVIEQTFALGTLPEGVNYKAVPYMDGSKTYYSIGYVQDREDAVNEPFYTMNMIQLIQETKAEFSERFHTPEYVDVKEVTVGGCPGYLVAQERYCGRLNVLIWDSGEYIFRLCCILPEEDVLKLAESLVPCGETEVLS